jgi:methoxymalonate biosynthesis acyl carrier protein
MDVRTRIGTYVRRAVAEPIEDDDDIFDLGIVDSLFALQLVAFVESEFSIVAERHDLDIRNFCSIAALSAFVDGKLGSSAERGPGHGHSSD